MRVFSKFIQLALAAPFLLVPLFASGLTGDDVNVSHYLFPGHTFLYNDLGTQTVPTGLFSYQSGVYTVQVNDNTIDFNFVCPGCHWGDFGGFNGPGVTDLSRAPITGVTIDPSTSYVGFDASRLSFDGSHIFLNLANLGINGFIRLNVDAVAATETPEPGTMGLLGLSLAAITLAVRRARN